jgi:uncharacterized protein (DUF362 family)
MNRREFCHQLVIVGGALLATPVINACTRIETTLTSVAPTATSVPPAPTATLTPHPTSTLAPSPTSTSTLQPALTPQPLQDSTLAKIALVKTRDRAAGVRRAIELLGVNPVRSNQVLLKPNLNSADAAPGSTHPEVLRTLVTELYDMGAQTITLADRSGMGDTRRVMQQTGVTDLAQELGFTTIVLDDLPEKDWIVQQSEDFHWSRGYAVPKLLLDAECVVQTCNLKTHRYGGHFTLSLKNSVGLAAKSVNGGSYNYMQELHNSPHQRHMIAEINAAYSPSLIVMDGVEAFVNGGPDRGKKVDSEVVLAGTDRIALDAVGVAILRLFGTTPEVSRGGIFEQEQIARAVELGLGIDSPDKIAFITDDSASQAYAEQIRNTLRM